jgi:TRAP-type mannitol/chloroaromatic compound transport system substrate-binding protein
MRIGGTGGLPLTKRCGTAADSGGDIYPALEKVQIDAAEVGQSV